MRKVVLLDDHNQRIMKILDDPVEVHNAMFDWLFQKLPYQCIVTDDDVDIDNQTINGVPISVIYAGKVREVLAGDRYNDQPL